MLTGTRQFDEVEAQIQCPPLLHKQFLKVALEAWDQIIPQEKPKGSYTKIFQGPNEAYADFLARLKVTISHSVIREKAKKQLKKKKLLMRIQIKNVKDLSLQFMRLRLLLTI